MTPTWGRLRAASMGFALLFVASNAGAADEGSIHGSVACRSLRNCSGALVYVERIPGRTFAPGPPVAIDQLNLAFVPHVLPIVTGTTVVFPNSDDVRHNVFSASRAKRFNLGTYPRGVTKQLTFDTPGVVELLCNIHTEMSAYIVVADAPYAAMVRADGTYLLEGVPVGTFAVVAWHESLTPQRQVVTVRRGESVGLDFDLH